MKIRGHNLTEQKKILNECSDAKEYYFRVLESKRLNHEWAENIPCDMNVYHAHRGETEHLRGPYDRNAKLRTKERK